MPEGPELRMNSLFINNVCGRVVFCGPPIRSSVSKNPEIDWESPQYTISSESRGKELALFLHCQKVKGRKKRILFRFGMSGKFTFTGSDSIPKHAHLQFRSVPGKLEGEEPQVLSFVDPRRFGSWHITEDWGENRGPDIINEFDQFRVNVLCSLDNAAFNRPICEAMLNQKYFNGIGNYLRAEILYRAKIPPFTCARVIFEPLTEEPAKDASPASGVQHLPDVLTLCRDVSQEVIQLKIGLGKSEVLPASVSAEDHTAFLNWLQCYNNPSMSIMKDKSGRSIWFHGTPGPMAPKGGVLRPAKRRRAPDNPNPVTNLDSKDGVKQERKETATGAMKTKKVKTEKISDAIPVGKSQGSKRRAGRDERRESKRRPGKDSVAPVSQRKSARLQCRGLK